jgi:hypothetical protein
MNLFTAAGREDTYKSRWILNGLQSARNMSRAGLFRIRLPVDNVNDSVVCSYCDLHLNKWNSEDVPIIEHSKWNPNCPFIRQFPEGTDDPSELLEVFPEGLWGSCACHRHLDPNMHFFEEAYENLHEERKKLVSRPEKRCN